ncbi:MAG: hypothetical protein ACJ8F7_19465, partial [Gemmataceae bacterium]
AALLGLAVGHARAADAPAALPKGPGDPAAPAVAPQAPAPTQGQVAPPTAPVVVMPPTAACCPAPASCEAPLKKVCVGEKATRTVEKRVYNETCEDFCQPKCSLFGGFGGFLKGHKHADCGDCADGGCQTCTKCEHCVRTRKFLVIHFPKEEECYNKCHVEYQPEEAKCKTSLFHHQKECCADGACAGAVVAPPAGAVVPPAPMPPAEKLPNPPKEKK